MGTAMRSNHSKRETRRDAPSAVRPWWLNAVMSDVQRLVGHFVLGDPDDVEPTLLAFAESLPAPRRNVERLILRGLLLDVAWRSATALHDRAHKGATDCTFEPAATLSHFLQRSAEDPRSTFRRWVESFLAEFRKTHPITAATKVGRLIKHNYQRAWTLSELASRFHVTPHQLRRAFIKEFGLSVHEYQRIIRVLAALNQVPREKVDAVALEVGWRSKKNFYRAFEEVTGLTPTAFRRLSNERALQIVEAASAIRQRRSRR
jgi:AraC-like DNA-binding protein